MNPEFQKLAQQAGFEFDPKSLNFYHHNPEEPINDKITKLVCLTLLKAIEHTQVLTK